MNAVDSNILLYSIDAREPIKQAKAQQLLQDLHASTQRTVLLWQVLGEVTQQIRRWQNKGGLSVEETDLHIAAFRHVFTLELPTEKTFDLAVALFDQYSLSHWDSMLLGACQSAGITRLFTEDMGSPRMIGQIQLVNPFL